MEYQYIVCHYGEIGLKGKNRKFFEEKLIENIKRVLKPGYFNSVRRISGRIIVKLNKVTSQAARDPVSGCLSSPRPGLGYIKEITKALQKVFGIVFFAFAIDSKQNIKVIQEKAFELLKEKKFTPLDRRGRHLTGFKTFKIFTQRSKKEFLMMSQQINEKVGEYVLKKLKACPVPSERSPVVRAKRSTTGRSEDWCGVNLKNPDITCFIEIVEKYAFLYTEKIRGLGGLPSGTGNKAVVLLSGGIDSPVAAFQTMKRGVRAIFVHFHASPFTSQASIDKVKKIAKILSDYQGCSKVYLIPFADVQKEIFLKTPAKLRVILYRRFMFKIAEEIAKKEKALALVTGESIGQVASQTLENIKVIDRAVDLPIFRPLIGQDKEEIITLARKIGTFDISILPHDDCCSRFLPKHPETKAEIKNVEKVERGLNSKKLISQAINRAQLDSF